MEGVTVSVVADSHGQEILEASVCLLVCEGTRPLGRPRRRWEDNIKMDIQEVEEGCGDRMERAQDRDRWRTLVSMVMNFRVP
jgi:hypothetical protein